MDLLFFLLYLLIYVICAVLMMLFYYYYRILMPGKENYHRSELVELKTILLNELSGLFAGMDKSREYLAVAAGSVTGLLLTYFGGIYGEHYESYFFHSVVFPAIFYFGVAFIQKNKMENEMPEFFKMAMRYDYSLFLGLTLSVLSKIVIVYGVYHVISFLWVLPNIILSYYMLINRIIEKKNKEDYKLFFKGKLTDN